MLHVKIGFTARDETPRSHRGRTVADPRTRPPLRIGDGGRDRVADAAGHGGEIARTAEHHGPAHVDVARDPGGDRAAVGDADGVVVEELVEFVRYHLRLHRQVRPPAAPLPPVPPGPGPLSLPRPEITTPLPA